MTYTNAFSSLICKFEIATDHTIRGNKNSLQASNDESPSPPACILSNRLLLDEMRKAWKKSVGFILFVNKHKHSLWLGTAFEARGRQSAIYKTIQILLYVSEILFLSSWVTSLDCPHCRFFVNRYWNNPSITFVFGAEQRHSLLISGQTFPAFISSYALCWNTISNIFSVWIDKEFNLVYLCWLMSYLY